MTHYHAVHVTREGKWWLLEEPTLEIAGQTRRLADAQDVATDLIAVFLDVPRSQVEVNLLLEDTPHVDHLGKRVHSLTELRQMIAGLESDLAREQRRLAADLVADEIPVRDIGTILGVSHQRAHVLAHEDR